MSLPSIETKKYWIYADRTTGFYPRQTDDSGKWLIFIDKDCVDELWNKIKQATEAGFLGETSKVSTAKVKEGYNPNQRVICVFTYDCKDVKDVKRIRAYLTNLGITTPIPYKKDKLTKAIKTTQNTTENLNEFFE